MIRQSSNAKDAPKRNEFRAAAWLGVAVAGAVVAVAAPAGQPTVPADLVLSGGAIYTVDAARSWAEALAVRGGRIVYVGSDDGAKAFIGPATRIVELGGRFVLPGFHDSHLHPISGGMRALHCELSGAATAAEALERVRAYAAAHPDRPWVVGRGWELPLFPAGNPRKEALDAVVSDRPVYLTAADGHSAWVNSRALSLAGVTAATPDQAAPASATPAMIRPILMSILRGWRPLGRLHSFTRTPPQSCSPPPPPLRPPRRTARTAPRRRPSPPPRARPGPRTRDAGAPRRGRPRRAP